MLGRITAATTRRPRSFLGVVALLTALAAVFGSGIMTALTNGGFTDPASPSSVAQDQLRRHFGTGSTNFVLLLTATSGPVDRPDTAAAGQRLVTRLAAEPDVAEVVSPWAAGAGPGLVSADRRQALVLTRVSGDEDAALRAVERLGTVYGADLDGLEVQLGGRLQMDRDVQDQLAEDLLRAELFSLPVLLVLLVVVFGGVVPAALPLLVGGVAIAGTFLALRLLTLVTDVSVFAINLTTALGLGLAIDYSLFLLSRYREEREGGLASSDAVVVAVRTAGRTIVFSAVTVAASLLVLLVFPLVFLRSFAYAGLAVVAVAAGAAVLVLPPLIVLLGHRVERRARYRSRRTRRGPRRAHGPAPSYPPGTGFWGRQAARSMDHPLLLGGTVLVLLLALGLPFLGVRFGLPDPRVQPRDAESRQVFEQVRAGFAAGELSPLTVVVPDRARVDDTVLADYATTLSDLPGVARVDAATGSYADGRPVAAATTAAARFSAAGAAWLAVVPSVEPVSVDGERLVQAVRAVDSPAPVVVGGAAAELVDTKASLGDRLPTALAAMAVVSFVILFLFSGSVLVPVKALALNVLSLSASFGALVWIFQEGHLSGLLGFTSTGTLDTNMPILLFCLAFGLSMDYEIFLLSRIKEEHDRTGDNRQSVIRGLDSTGPLVSAAAALMAVVLVALVTSSISFLKLLGLGTALAVVMDATLVRGVLVPVAMRLAGEVSWWAPRWLRVVHDRLGLAEAPAPARRPSSPEPPRVAAPVPEQSSPPALAGSRPS